MEIEPAGIALAVVHGNLSEINRFVFASTPEEVKAADLERSAVDGIVAGHCGLPFTQVIRGRLWHNPGAVGMPANDGTSRVWFSSGWSNPGFDRSPGQPLSARTAAKPFLASTICEGLVQDQEGPDRQLDEAAEKET